MLLVFREPVPLVSDLISLGAWAAKINNPNHCDHCAICLTDFINYPEVTVTRVYEAVPPVAQKEVLVDFQERIDRNAAMRMRWRERTSNYLSMEVWRPPSPLDEATLHAEWTEAEKWLGAKYGLFWNYVHGSDKIHCSEYVGRILTAGSQATWKMEPGRIQPIMVRLAVANRGYELVATYRPIQPEAIAT